jgi:hypothetical protein
MSLEERLTALEKSNEPREEPIQCVFCIDGYNFFTDIVQNAYSLKYKLDHPLHSYCDNPKDCIHNKYPELKDSLRVAWYIRDCFIYNDYDMNERTPFFVAAHIYNNEDIRKTLLDEPLNQFILVRAYQEIKHYQAYHEVEHEKPQYWATRLELVAEARRREQKYRQESKNYFERAKECVKLSKYLITNYDFTSQEWNRTDKKHSINYFLWTDKLKEAEELTGLTFHQTVLDVTD